jgi:hypothetical protein
MSTFRKFTNAETAAVLKLIARGDGKNTTLSAKRARMLTVRFDHTENFTVAVLKNGKAIITGVAKRNPNDKFNAEAGEALALRRAIVNAYPPGVPTPEEGEDGSGETDTTTTAGRAAAVAGRKPTITRATKPRTAARRRKSAATEPVKPRARRARA